MKILAGFVLFSHSQLCVAQPDGAIDISDGAALLGFLFLGSKAHSAAPPQDPLSSCVALQGCAENQSCSP